MPESALQKASVVYGNKSLEDDLPRNNTYFGVWDLPQKDQQRLEFKVGLSAAVNQGVTVEVVNDWTENENSFMQTELLDIKDNQVKKIIFLIRKSQSIVNHFSLANRLLTLFIDAKEEDPFSPGITVGSLKNFYYFLLLSLHKKLKVPTISLTPENNIYASWRDEQSRVFSVHFLSNEDVRFVIFKPNDKHPERKIRLSGTATTDTLIDSAIPSDVWDWISG